jgi:uncharacterized protein YqeY
MLKQQIEQDLKAALLSGDKVKTTTLRGLKNAILYVEVAEGKRDQGIDDQKIQEVLAKESKKRQESADLYKQGGGTERAEAELVEKKIIDGYLPKQLSDAEINTLIDEYIAAEPVSGMADMGRTIGAVKAKAGASADGAAIARLVKERLAET